MDGRQVVDRFKADRHAPAMINHANLAMISDAVVTDSSRVCFVMEHPLGIKITDYIC